MTSAAAQPQGDAALVEMRDIAKTFDVSPPWLERMLAGLPPVRLHAVDGVSLSIRRGETLALVGESGCGKSTLARMTVGLIAPTRGSVAFDGVTLYGDGASTDAAALRRARTSMQMIFQDPYASLNPRWRVADIVAEPIVAAEPRLPRAEVARRVRALLQQVGLASGDVHKFPHQFSGGQRQRISIARALSTHPAFIVCDEPTSALDVSVQAQVLNLMRDLQHRLGLAYLFISHNLAVVHHIADRVSVMYLGRIVESADTRRLFAATRHPYTQMLLDAVPDLHAPGGMAAAVTTAAATGEVPDAFAQRSGCGFHPRCPFANARCRSEAPALLHHDGGDAVACHGVEEKRVAPRASVAALARLAATPGAAAAGIPL
ncbi:MAG: oligopeptide/dipeptide ABC transporter ATP-binding protein [Betaproteobacteria bacterium]